VSERTYDDYEMERLAAERAHHLRTAPINGGEFAFMNGATIVSAGLIDCLDGSQVIEGGFTLDLCMPNGSARRVVLGYTELGEWIEFDSGAETKP